jgi:hypothetical protein
MTSSTPSSAWMMAVRRQRDEPKDGEHLDEPDDAKKMSFVCRIDSASVSPPAPSPCCFLRRGAQNFTRCALHLRTTCGWTRRSSKLGSTPPAASSTAPESQRASSPRRWGGAAQQGADNLHRTTLLLLLCFYRWWHWRGCFRARPKVDDGGEGSAMARL